MGKMIIIDGVRYREEEAELLGITAESRASGETPALSLTAAQVPIEALVEARVQKILTELEAQYEERLQAALAEALAAGAEGGSESGSEGAAETTKTTEVEPPKSRKRGKPAGATEGSATE